MFAKLAVIAAVASAALGNPLPREPSPPTGKSPSVVLNVPKYIALTDVIRHGHPPVRAHLGAPGERVLL